MTIRRLIYFSDRAAGLLGTISSSTVNAAIEKAYGVPAPAQDERLRAAFMEGYQQGIDSEFSDPEAAWNRSRTIHLALDLEQARPAQTEQQPVAVPEGWKLVPVQPTAEMLAAVTTSTFEPLRQEAMKMAREDYQAMLYAAPIAQTEQQPAYVECRECTDCGHVGINDAHPTDATCAMCDWSGPSPVEDQCPDCGKENAMGAACPKCSGRYRILAETHVAAPIAQTGQQPEQSGLRAGQVVAMCEVGHDRLERAALDTKRLEWMLAERCIIESQSGTGSPAVYRVAWPGLGEAQSEWYPTEREAIDNAQGSCHE